MPDDDNLNSPGQPAPIPPHGAVAPGSPVSQPALGQQTEIVLNPRSAPRPAAPEQKKATPTKAPEPKDSFREVVETIVFVVVLVLLLKTFLAEAFVIPTGSMATTLLGYHREVTCQQCGYTFTVNASKEADPQEPDHRDVVSCTCPNCEFENRLKPFGGGLPR
jgi:rubredoxin